MTGLDTCLLRMPLNQPLTAIFGGGTCTMLMAGLLKVMTFTSTRKIGTLGGLAQISRHGVPGTMTTIFTGPLMKKPNH